MLMGHTVEHKISSEKREARRLANRRQIVGQIGTKKGM